MLLYITGIPGSGKTAFAVSKILSSKRSIIYTNINQFKFNLLENVKPLDWELLYVNIIKLYEKVKNDKVSDKILKEYAKELGFFDCVFFIDECQEYFDKNDKVLIWWLSYHRHLNQDIYLITQNLSLLFTKYKAFCEVCYRAKPSLLRFKKNVLVYNKYVSTRMYKNEKFGEDKIDLKKVEKAYFFAEKAHE